MIDAEAEADSAAVARVLAGDREAFAVLVARYARRVHDLARRMLRDATEAEDVSQHAFLNAYRALDRFDPRRPFRHWLLRIASNLCRNRIAERRRRPALLSFTSDGADGDPRTFDPPAPLDPHDDEPVDAGRVRDALESLPPRYRLTAVLRYAHGLPLEDIAEITGEPMATVKTHLHRARAALSRRLAPPPAGETEARPAGTKG